MNDELLDDIKSLAWSLVLADHLGDVWDEVFAVIKAAGLPEPVQDDEGMWCMQWPISTEYPEDEVEEYERVLRGGLKYEEEQ